VADAETAVVVEAVLVAVVRCDSDGEKALVDDVVVTVVGDTLPVSLSLVTADV
jgi:predicted transcriptional regulator